MKRIILVIIAFAIVIGGYFLLKRNDQAPVSVPAQSQPQTQSQTKEFTIIVKKWEFSPEEIIVNKGDTVKLHIESIDVMHGFGLLAFGINEDLEPGKIIDVEFIVDKTGTFTFTCTVFCGSGHRDMKGQLIVE